MTRLMKMAECADDLYSFHGEVDGETNGLYERKGKKQPFPLERERWL